MKKMLLLTGVFILASSCSVMQKHMMKRMEKMPEEEKLAMMSEMMKNSGNHSCNDMMSKMSKVFMADSLSKPEMASEMLPVCISGILSDVEPANRSAYLLGLTKEILTEGYDSIPLTDKERFREELLRMAEELEP